MISDFLLTSCEIVFRASQFSLGSMFWMSSGLISASTCSSSASLGWRGKAAGFVLQVLRAQQRKLRVRSFIVNVSFFFLSSSGVKMIWGWVLLFKSLLDVCKCHFKKLCVGQSEVKLTPRLYTNPSLYMSDNSISDKTLSSVSFNKFNMRIDRDSRLGHRRDGIGSSNMYIQRDINKASIKIKAVVTEQRH